MPRTYSAGQVKATLEVNARQWVQSIKAAQKENRGLTQELETVRTRIRTFQQQVEKDGPTKQANAELRRLQVRSRQLQSSITKNTTALDRMATGLRKTNRQLTLTARKAQAASTATRALNRLAAALPAIGGAAALAGLNRLVDGLREAAEHAQTLTNRARGVGVAVDDFQALTQVFASFGLESDDVNDALNEINVKLGDAASGVKSAKDAFATLGIEIVDGAGHLRRNVDVWNDLVRAVRAGGDAETTNAVDAIVGGDLARRALPLLQQNAEQYDALLDKSRSIVTPTETIERLTAQHAENIQAAAERQVDLNRAAAGLEPIIDAWNEAAGTFVRLLADAAEFIGEQERRPAGLSLAEGPREAHKQFIRLNAAVQQGRVALEDVAHLGPELNRLAVKSKLLFDEKDLRRVREVTSMIDDLLSPAETPEVEVKVKLKPIETPDLSNINPIVTPDLSNLSIKEITKGLSETDKLINRINYLKDVREDLADTAPPPLAPPDFENQIDIIANRTVDAADRTTEAWARTSAELARNVAQMTNLSDTGQQLLDIFIQLAQQAGAFQALGGAIGGLFSAPSDADAQIDNRVLSILADARSVT